ncbi:MAG: hypothetical protein COV52_06875 [Gammaproteobacteria bacterium CG11_big_fil_rev_8_21_14_0_20_46_22]|nr:MAG: hypothetical protein COW05_02325 [Gammaproteobacteria bacterium CG12_big_fil_rev_8_21_14_0_65_46_12]PIR10763.1 MAG: hypothetical protein COV52_06875 [Gammaproteobacteria bacterium CG11_big_fil_rev_8_21_14_0_20_46_22]
MRVWPFSHIAQQLVKWLTKEHEPSEIAMCDIERVVEALLPADVLLVEGRSRISEVIKVTTRSNWSHSALYIGRIKDYPEGKTKDQLTRYFSGSHDEPLLIEAILGRGVILTPVRDYAKDHLRLCRASALAAEDQQAVINYCISSLGEHYNLRRIVDLLRLLFPITFMPRYAFTSLLNPIKARKERRHICSSLIARAFHSVKYPILPRIVKKPGNTFELIPRNPALFTPKDFDFSPYFQIIKYPLYGFTKDTAYKSFPWNQDGLMSNDDAGIFDPKSLMDDEKQT